MTNKERYQRTFQTLHASAFKMEGIEMKKAKHLSPRRLALASAILVLLLGLATGAYATDVGGIRRQIQIWIHGDQTDAILETSQGHYSLTYEDEEGNVQHRYGGGVSFEADGTERPLTEAEIMEHLDSPDVQYLEDDSVWVYYRGESMEITDKFEGGICHVMLLDNGKPLYLTVSYRDGYSMSSHSYPDP